MHQGLASDAVNMTSKSGHTLAHMPLWLLPTVGHAQRWLHIRSIYDYAAVVVANRLSKHIAAHLDEEGLVVQLLPQRLDLRPQRGVFPRPVLVHPHLRASSIVTPKQTEEYVN